MVDIRDLDNRKLNPGDKILYIKSGKLEKATVISIGREHLTARRVSDDGIARLGVHVSPNKHILRYDW